MRTDNGYLIEIDYEGDVCLSHHTEVDTVYLSQHDIETIVSMIKEFENGCED